METVQLFCHARAVMGQAVFVTIITADDQAFLTTTTAGLSQSAK